MLVKTAVIRNVDGCFTFCGIVLESNRKPPNYLRFLCQNRLVQWEEKVYDELQKIIER